MWKISSQGHILSTIGNVLKRYIFKELLFLPGSLNQLFPFVWQFYACPSPLYFSQAFRHGDLIVISLESSQQGDPPRGALFALPHLHTLHPTTTTHPTCVFPSLVDDTHMVGPTLDVVPCFLYYGMNF
jgi:hypothetical protein